MQRYRVRQGAKATREDGSILDAGTVFEPTFFELAANREVLEPLGVVIDVGEPPILEEFEGP